MSCVNIQTEVINVVTKLVNELSKKYKFDKTEALDFLNLDSKQPNLTIHTKNTPHKKNNKIFKRPQLTDLSPDIIDYIVLFMDSECKEMLSKVNKQFRYLKTGCRISIKYTLSSYSLLKWGFDNKYPILKNLSTMSDLLKMSWWKVNEDKHLKFLKLIRSRSVGKEWVQLMMFYVNEQLLCVALHCHLEVFKLVQQWAQSNFRNKCTHLSLTKKKAIHGGYLEYLEWARNNGFGQNAYKWLLEAAKNGDLEFLKCELGKNKKITMCSEITLKMCTLAAGDGHLEVLKWAQNNGCFKWAQNNVCREWTRNKGCPWDSEVCSQAAAYGGHLEVLKWARNNGYPLSLDCILSAARNGHLDIIKFASSNGCPLLPLCKEAARHGHLEILKWALSNRCQNFQSCKIIIQEAARSGELEVLKWAKNNGCQWNENRIGKLILYLHLLLRFPGYHAQNVQNVQDWLLDNLISNPLHKYRLQIQLYGV